MLNSSKSPWGIAIEYCIRIKSIIVEMKWKENKVIWVVRNDEVGRDQLLRKNNLCMFLGVRGFDNGESEREREREREKY